MKKFIFILAFFASISFLSNAQTGEIKGKVHDSKTKETIPGVSIFVKYGGKTLNTVTDIDGNFTLKPLESGTYNVYFTYLSYDSILIRNVVVSPDRITFLNETAMEQSTKVLSTLVISAYQDPIINPENYNYISPKQIEHLAGKGDIKNMIATLSGGVQRTESGELSFRGARVGDAAYYVDGVKCADGNPRVPSGSIKSMTVYNGGIPAKYGDTMGGCVVIETMNFFDYYYSQNR